MISKYAPTMQRFEQMGRLSNPVLSCLITVGIDNYLTTLKEVVLPLLKKYSVYDD